MEELRYTLRTTEQSQRCSSAI